MALPLLASAHWPSRKQGQCGGAAARMASGLARRLREAVRPEVWLSSQGGPRCRGRDTSPRRSLRSCARWTCLVSQGKSVADAVRSIRITEVTYYRWRQEFGGLKSDQSSD